MWKHCLNLIICTCIPAFLLAQQKLTGKITDAKKHPLPGVNIYIKGTYDGATTAADGSFSFTTTATGAQVISASLIGYKTLEQPTTISGPLQLNLTLKEAINELKVVTISAGSFEASNDRKNTVLKPLDIVTTAGATADIVNALKTLPGAQQTNDREGLFVRGGTGYETQIFIDGLLVRNPFYTSLPDLPGRGRFSPFLFKGTTFSSGGYSAQYGQGLSSALILESEDLPARSSYSLGASLIGVNGGLDELSKDKKTSYGIEADYTNLAPYFNIARPRQEPTMGPEILGTSANFRHKTSSTGMIKFYGYGNWSRMGFRKNSTEYPGYQEQSDVRNQNIYTNLTYRESLGSGWRLQTGFSFSTNDDKIKIDTIRKTAPANIRNRSELSQLRLMLTKSLGAFSMLRLGGEYQYAAERGAFNNYQANYVDNYTAAFAESDIYFTPQFVGRVGGRMEYSSVLSKVNWAPRASLAYKLNDYSQFSLAYGDYYQKPEPQYLRYQRDLDYMKATHYIASFQRVSMDYTFRVEAFYKKYKDLVKTVPDTSNMGTGYAKGIELFWRDRKTFKNVDYWISYSFLDTKRNYLFYPFEVQPDFAAKHTASLVVKKYIPKITTNIGLTYSYASGRPYYNPNLPESKFMSERTIDFNTLGLSASYLTTVGKAFTVFVLSVTNVFDIKQVYGYRYSTDKLRREEIVPNAPRFLFIGMFMNFGIDNRQDVINNL
ncbi:TonB-dependent receptor plug domain-containing protein [Chitinophaga agrisoli]|uniref:TonB-dependent receptor plug domain-containing protein n=1 Tax=Chitinophaga agrisoli TaxID=2607653 RepID=A0A5B2W2M1_9BACT|nr:TonB-dependent receptor [Chitinophaga agrisoli]KAA2245625.1 TonB-dependent receptor plug domain-containing protein [Chitinophaga agrisoli]